MPRRCSICGHASRGNLEAALLEGVPLRTIADRHNVSKTALIRHRDEHLPAMLVRAHEAGEVADADDLLAQVRDLQRRTLSILEGAETSGQGRLALSAIREARSNLELLGRLAGELRDGAQFNIAVSTEWVELRGVIVGALHSHPEARETVLEALESVGDG